MRIYSNPELPDITVGWHTGVSVVWPDCEETSDDVVLLLIGIDDPALRSELVTPCTTASATFSDVARQQFRIEGKVLDGSRDAVATSESETGDVVDLRAGFDVSSTLIF